MTKLCFACFKRIPLFAGKCPYCLDNDQGVFGRILFSLSIVILLIFLASRGEQKQIYKQSNIEQNQNYKQKVIGPYYKLKSKSLTPDELLEKLRYK